MTTFATRLLCFLFLIGASASTVSARQVAIATGLEEYEKWDEEIVELFSKIPVQDDGRIKPLETVARFRLYRIYGKRTLRFGVEKGDEVEKIKLTPVEWYLDCLFRPKVAKQIPFIMVNNVDVISDIGLKHHTGGSGTAVLRSGYTYEEIAPALPEPGNPTNRGKLSEKRDEYIAAKEEDPKRFADDLLKQQVIDLHDRLAVLNYLLHMNDFAQGDLIPGIPLAAIAPSLGDADAKTTPLSEWLGNWRKIAPAAAADGTYTPAELQNMLPRIGAEVERIAGIAGADPLHPIAGIAIFAPAKPKDDDWTTIGEEIVKTISEDEPYTEGVARIQFFEALVRHGKAGDQKEFKAVLKPFVEDRIAEAEARGDYDSVPLELKYYKSKFVANAVPWFVFSFVFVALGWLVPATKVAKYLGWASVATCLLGLAYSVGMIVMRCMIMSRPPIATLYETILFITATGVVLALILEYFDRKMIALAAAALLGGAGMWFSNIYEMKEALDGRGDTMVTLQAVLRSNFWLGTHVVIINLGYMAALLGCAMSFKYIISRLVNGGAPDNEWEKSISRMVYGVICFTLVFSLIGTVLGGIWANDSWGRFWGWDPKENGALMIVLWSLVILHARMGGYIKRIGMHAASVLLGMITVFSWWGVNELNVGLHTYGSTSGVKEKLMITYGIGLVFIVLAGVVWLMERAATQARLEAKGRGKRVEA